MNDGKGKRVCNPQQIHNIVNDHFKKHFNNTSAKFIEPFNGPPKDLNTPVTSEEVKKSVTLMNNNRAAGYDRIQIELIKYGNDQLFQEISNTINTTFAKHQPIDVGKGLLIALQKPGKPKGPVKNLRPIILLPIIRKIMSTILLQRTKVKVNEYLSPSQSAYRPSRSTSDIVWAHRWLLAKAQTVDTTLYITGIDMSSAFDTVDREKLLNIIETFMDEDQVRMTRLLLSNTTLEIKMNGDVTTEPFTSNTGSPQGDGYSGCIFNIYFEASLRKLRAELNNNAVTTEHSYCTQFIPPYPEEAIYADDADFISVDQVRRDKLISIVSGILKQDGLIVNDAKTEHTILKRQKVHNNESWRSTKKLGSYLGDREDIAHRKQLAVAAANELNTVWIRNTHINQKLRIELYNSIVRPVLTYNCSAWGLSKKDEDCLDSFHRRQLRRVLNIKWPHRISNANVYKTTRSHPISIDILKARWRLFGHVLRMGNETPAVKAMHYFFSTIKAARKFRGRPRTTIHTTLSKDVKDLLATNSDFINTLNIPKTFSKISDLERFQSIAQDRKIWKKIIKVLGHAAKAKKSYNMI